MYMYVYVHTFICMSFSSQNNCKKILESIRELLTTPLFRVNPL